MFELKRNGVRWMPTTPINSTGEVAYAFVPTLSCTLEVVAGKARLNGGVWRAMPCFLVDGSNMLGLVSYPEGVHALQFTDTSDIFNDVSPVDNAAQTVQNVVIDFVNLGSVTRHVNMIQPTDSITANFGVSPVGAVVIVGAVQSFTFTRTPKMPLYWGSMKDVTSFGIEVIDA